MITRCLNSRVSRVRRAFHRYLYKPFKAGTFKKGASGRFCSFIKGGLAALFVKREIRIASEDVKANPTLCKLLAKPLAKFGDLMGGLVNNLEGGDITSIGAAEETLNTITSLAGGKGVIIQEDANASLNSWTVVRSLSRAVRARIRARRARSWPRVRCRGCRTHRRVP